MYSVQIADFFAFARLRYEVFLKKEDGEPKPWTTDEILLKYKFCNIFREDDTVTRWFKKNIRDPLENDAAVLLATVAFRQFNLIETGENMLKFGFDLFFDWDKHKAEFAKLAKAQDKKVTGAYMTRTPHSINKVDGAIQVIDWFIEHCEGNTELTAINWIHQGISLEDATNFIAESPYLGQFYAYEITTDLRHTALLDDASDILTWASPGPGAARGLSRLCGLDKDSLSRQKKGDVGLMMVMMRNLLEFANNTEFGYWPEEYPKWEMREVEHTLCEFDKYERVRTGQGAPRSRYNGLI